MPAESLQIQNLDELRQFVNSTLCDEEQLEPTAFDLTERLLVRGDRPCGIYFCLHGPRSLKITAIWETDRNTVLFYGANGERFHRAQLQGTPPLARKAG